MGITIHNHKYSIDMGYGGFLNLRTTIARLLNCEEFVNAYKELGLPPYRRAEQMGFDDVKDYWNAYDERVQDICERNNLDPYVIDFLYRSDASYDSVSITTCRHLWKFIKDYDDNILYGYCGRPDCAKFKDFKNIVESCVQDRRVMRFG